MECSEAEQILRNLSSVASRFGLPDEGRALARCVRIPKFEEASKSGNEEHNTVESDEDEAFHFDRLARLVCLMIFG